MFGASRNPYLQPREWQVNLALRTLTSDEHYRQDHEEVQRHELGTYVINRQNMVDLTATYAFTRRFNVSFGVPWVSASWSIPSPTRPVPGTRAQQDARGLGDITAVGRYWLFDPSKRFDGNVAVGCGVKAPTGKYDAQDTYPDSNGLNNQLRYVDQSVQPGDGGWGVIFEAQGFKRMSRRAAVFASGTYLANPRNTNGTPSLVIARGGTPSATNADRLVNSVPDQYVVRAGGSVGVWRNIAFMAAWRVEGLRRYDLFGASNGFRRPGVAMFLEPGITISNGPHTIAFNLPIGYYYNRKPDPNTGNLGDATFPRFIALGTYGFRFGKPAPAAQAQ